MAEILVRLVDNENRHDPVADQMCYKRGDPVVVMPDGHEWGRKEGPPNFAVVKVPGVNYLDLRERLLHSERSDMVFGDDGEGVKIRRRACHLDLSTFAARTVADIERTGEVTLTREAAETRLIDKATGERAITAEVRG